MDALTWTAETAASHVRVPTRTDDKYSRGVVGLRTGSDAYPGAAVLGVEAAWRTGTGMVRYLGPRPARELVLHRRPETVTVPGRVQAWVVGSGMDAASRGDDETRAIRDLLDGDIPVVADAGALDLAPGGSAPRVVTPHSREHAALRRRLGLAERPQDDDAQRAACARETAAALSATVLVKGFVTIIATPAGWTARVESGTPWLATAGTGDVLAGVLGALVAGAQAEAEARGGTLDAEAIGPLAASAAWLHGRAAAHAAARAGDGSDGPITALDVAAALPAVVAETSRLAPMLSRDADA